jgi:hypothetical protein
MLALLKMAEVLSVSIGAIFPQAMEVEKRFIFPRREAMPFKLTDLRAPRLKEGYQPRPILKKKWSQTSLKSCPEKSSQLISFLTRVKR